MEIQELNSFSAFVDDTSLSDANRIRRDFHNYMLKQMGTGMFARSEGSPLFAVENEGNSDLADVLLKVSIVEAAGKYNLQAPPEMRVIVGSDMVSIKRNGPNINILVIFIPAIDVRREALNQLVLTIPSAGG